MRYLFLVLPIILCIECSNAYSQCGTVDYTPQFSGFANRSSEYDLSKIQTWNNPLSQEPIKEVRVVLVFFHDDYGNNGFHYSSNTAHKAFIDDLIEKVNDVYENIPSANGASTECSYYSSPADSRLRAKVVNVVEVDNSVYWNNDNDNLCPGDDSWYLHDFDQSLRDSLDQDSAMFIYFTDYADAMYDLVANGACSENFSWSEIDCSMYPEDDIPLRVHMRNEYIKYYWMKYCLPDPPNLTYSTIYSWNVDGQGAVLAHEIGHALSLMHVPTQCTSMLMETGSIGGGIHYLSPDEIKELHGAAEYSKLQNYIEDGVTDYGYERVISSNTAINSNVRLYSSLRVTSGTTLTITCRVQLPIFGRIILESGSRLVCDGCTLTSKTVWDGIEVGGNASHSQLNTGPPRARLQRARIV